MTQVDQDVLGHPQRPLQAQPWGVQGVLFMFMDTLRDLNKLNNCEYSKYQLYSSKIDMVMFICDQKKNRIQVVLG